MPLNGLYWQQAYGLLEVLLKNVNALIFVIYFGTLTFACFSGFSPLKGFPPKIGNGISLGYDIT